MIKKSIIAVLVVLASTTHAFASETVGTILPSFKFAKVCQDVRCTNFGVVNFAPTINAMTPGATPVTITDTAITGNLWGNQIGWVNLTPTGLTSIQTLKVNLTTGVITGLGFANTGSWINFSPTSGGVTINSVGEFVGWAWISGAYGGWMKFDCASDATCVKTDWRPIPNRTIAMPPGTGGGGGGGGPSTSPTPVIPIQPVPPVVLPTPTLPPKTTPTKNINTNTPNKAPVPNQIINTFDPDGNNTANKPPTDITDIDTGTIVPSTNGIQQGTVNSQQGEYRQAFPARQEGFVPEKNCFWCVVIRRDTAPAEKIVRATNGTIFTRQIVDKERHIIKYGFVPKKFEIRIPVSKVVEIAGVETKTTTDLDVTSSVLTLLVLALIRKIIITLI